MNCLEGIVVLIVHFLLQIEIVDLVVNGVPYQFKLASLDVEYVHSLAKEFCLSYQDGASLTPEKLEAGCTQVSLRCSLSILNTLSYYC